MDRTDCPDEETLASYLDGVLRDEVRSSIETHLAKRTSCREEISAVYTQKCRILDKLREKLGKPTSP